MRQACGLACISILLVPIAAAVGMRGGRAGSLQPAVRIEPAAAKYEPVQPPSPRDRTRSALDASQSTVDAIQSSVASITRDVSDWQQQHRAKTDVPSGASETVASLLVEQLPRDRDGLGQVQRTIDFLESRWDRA